MEGLRTIAVKNNIDLPNYINGLQVDISLSDMQKGLLDGRWLDQYATNLWTDSRLAQLCDLTGQVEPMVIGGLS